MTRAALLALLLAAAPVAAGVEAHGRWRLLTYAPETFAPGQVKLVMLCLRAAQPVASVPHVTVLPESETPRRGKLGVLVTAAGFLPVESGELPAYVTVRVESLSAEPTRYGVRVWVMTTQ